MESRWYNPGRVLVDLSSANAATKIELLREIALCIPIMASRKQRVEEKRRLIIKEEEEKKQKEAAAAAVVGTRAAGVNGSGSGKGGTGGPKKKGKGKKGRR